MAARPPRPAGHGGGPGRRDGPERAPGPGPLPYLPSSDHDGAAARYPAGSHPRGHVEEGGGRGGPCPGSGESFLLAALRSAFPAWTVGYSTGAGVWIARAAAATICENSLVLLCAGLVLAERRDRQQQPPGERAARPRQPITTALPRGRPGRVGARMSALEMICLRGDAVMAGTAATGSGPPRPAGWEYLARLPGCLPGRVFNSGRVGWGAGRWMRARPPPPGRRVRRLRRRGGIWAGGIKISGTGPGSASGIWPSSLTTAPRWWRGPRPAWRGCPRGSGERADELLDAGGQLVAGDKQVRGLERWARYQARLGGAPAPGDEPEPLQCIEWSGRQTVTMPSLGVCPHCHRAVEVVNVLAAPGTDPPPSPP